MKCHLCRTYLTETAPIWEVGGRRRVAFKCLDQRCASIRVQSRCVIEAIMPDDEIMSYRLLIPHHDKWYRIWGRKNIEPPDDTTVYTMDLNGTGDEKFIINLPKYYPLSSKDDLWVRSNEILNKFKTLILFS